MNIDPISYNGQPIGSRRQQFEKPYWMVSGVVLVVAMTHLAFLIFANDHLAGDQQRYFEYAQRLLEGELAEANGAILNGPTLPAVVALGLKFDLSLNSIKLVSIVSICVIALLLFVSVTRVLNAIAGLLASLLFAWHPGILWIGSKLMTEPLGALLLTLACALSMSIPPGTFANTVRILALSLLFAALILLKFLFAYALIVVGVFGLVTSWALTPEWRRSWSVTSVAAIVSFVWCIPYLSFTYSEYGKAFYWGTTGGEHLYWMSIGGDNMWGSWVDIRDLKNKEYLVEQGIYDEVREIMTKPAVEQDRLYTSIALRRISEDPTIYLRNLAANIGRVLFNYPFSNRPQSLGTYGYIVPNLLLYVCLIMAVAICRLTKWSSNPSLAWFTLLGVTFLGGSVFVASSARHGLVFLPIFLLWIFHQWAATRGLGVIRVPHPN